MSALRGIRGLLRRDDAPQPLEEPAVPKISDDHARAPLAFDRDAADLWRQRLQTVLFDSYVGRAVVSGDIDASQARANVGDRRDREELRFRDDWPRGVRRAVTTWLASPSGSGFELRRDLEAYGMTTNPGGFLRRAS